MGVSKIIVHPSYSSSSSDPTDNLALVKVSSSVGDSYSKLCLPAQDSQVTGSVVLVGWRISSVVGSLAETLVSVSTEIVENCGIRSDLICTGEDTRLDVGHLWPPELALMLIFVEVIICSLFFQSGPAHFSNMGSPRFPIWFHQNHTPQVSPFWKSGRAHIGNLGPPILAMWAGPYFQSGLAHLTNMGSQFFFHYPIKTDNSL